MNTLLGSYDSGEEEEEAEGAAEGEATVAAVKTAAPRATAPVAAVKTAAPIPRKSAEAGRSALAPPPEPEIEQASHLATCQCDDCEALLARFAAKNLQTKGIRFRCKFCDEAMAKKENSSAHFRQRHGEHLQGFKKEKNPKLFEKKRRAQGPAKISFARDDILKKRPRDIDEAFGGWAKKEKPEPPPCEVAEQQGETEPILTAPPWANAQRPIDEDASQMDKEVDGHIAQAQVKRFSTRNTLEVRAGQARCKLCFKMIGLASCCAKHVIEAHEDDFQREMQIWERFLFTTCRRQPPFGWVCKVCQLFFPTDAAVWRHLGKEVFIRREERHQTVWKDKEDRWGHQEDEECCGDGMSGGGLSMESVKLIQQEAAREEAVAQAKRMSVKKGEESGEEEGPANLADVGVVKPISEF